MSLHMLVIIVDINIFRHQVNVLGHFSSYIYVLRREKKAEHPIFCATILRPAFLKVLIGMHIQDHC